MPKALKPWAKSRAKTFLNSLGEFGCLNNLINGAINFADEADTWADNKKTFFKHTNSIDKIRREDFFQVFPELAKLETLEQ
jgi:hypothetical protein